MILSWFLLYIPTSLLTVGISFRYRVLLKNYNIMAHSELNFKEIFSYFPTNWKTFKTIILITENINKFSRRLWMDLPTNIIIKHNYHLSLFSYSLGGIKYVNILHTNTPGQFYKNTIQFFFLYRPTVLPCTITTLSNAAIVRRFSKINFISTNIESIQMWRRSSPVSFVQRRLRCRRF